MTAIQDQYFAALILFAFGAITVIAFVLVNRFFAVSRKRSGKASIETHRAFVAYECGEVPIGDAHTRFNFQYYVFAIVFVIFDVITAFLFPWSLVIKTYLRTEGIIAVVGFLGIFLIGFAYWWKRDALRWM